MLRLVSLQLWEWPRQWRGRTAGDARVHNTGTSAGEGRSGLAASGFLRAHSDITVLQNLTDRSRRRAHPRIGDFSLPVGCTG